MMIVPALLCLVAGISANHPPQYEADPYAPYPDVYGASSAPQYAHIPEPKYQAPVKNYDLAAKKGPHPKKGPYTQEEEEYPDANNIPGEAGTDYPTFHKIPRTSFNCYDKIPGYYADPEAHCQLWHYCAEDKHMESFLCPNGTIYSQQKRVCQWWYDTDCENAPTHYSINEDLYIIPEPYYEKDEEKRPPHKVKYTEPKYSEPKPAKVKYAPAPKAKPETPKRKYSGPPRYQEAEPPKYDYPKYVDQSYNPNPPKYSPYDADIYPTRK